MLWEVWRVWLAGLATIDEIENKWDLCTLFEANEALDIKEEMEEEAQLRAEAKMNRK